MEAIIQGGEGTCSVFLGGMDARFRCGGRGWMYLFDEDWESFDKSAKALGVRVVEGVVNVLKRGRNLKAWTKNGLGGIGGGRMVRIETENVVGRCSAGDDGRSWGIWQLGQNVELVLLH